MAFFGIAAVCISMINFSTVHAYNTQVVSAPAVKKTGGFWFDIKGGPKGNSHIFIKLDRVSGASNFDDFFAKPSTWTASIDTSKSTNNHNVKIKNSKITTKLDNGSKSSPQPGYFIFNIPVEYDMPAHYIHKKNIVDKEPNSRANFRKYHQSEALEDTAIKTGYHSTTTSKREINIQINSAQTGVRTTKNDSGIIFVTNTTVGFEIDREKHNVNYVNGLGQTLKTQSVIDGEYATPPTNPTRKGYSFTGWNSSHGPICEDKTITAQWKPNSYNITYEGNGGTYNGQTSWSNNATYDSNYTVEENFFTKPGYTFTGWIDSDGKSWTPGSTQKWEIDKNVTLIAQWKPNTYTNKIEHWIWGLNGDGNSDDKNAFNIGKTAFSKNMNESFTLSNSEAVKIPNGFSFGQTVRTDAEGNGLKRYDLPHTFIQNYKNLSFDYDYYPITYSITYDLNGAVNNEENPSSYNVLQEIKFKKPTKPGYEFVGWSVNGQIVTGINEGINNRFTSIQDAYDRLNGRTTGDITVKAVWNSLPTFDLKDFQVIEKSDFPVSNLIDGKGFIDDNSDPEFPDKKKKVEYPAKANDKEDGDISDRIIVVKVVNPNGDIVPNVDTTKLGNYEVTYQVTDDNGKMVEGKRTITVIEESTPIFFPPDINIPPNDACNPNTTTLNDVLDKILIEDAYDGRLTPEVVIDKIDFKKSGDYEITISVTNSSNVTMKKKIKVHVVDSICPANEHSSSIRFIDKVHINTLYDDSKWKNNSVLWNTLNDSLNRTTPIKVYKYTSNDIHSLKEDIRNDNGFKKQ